MKTLYRIGISVLGICALVLSCSKKEESAPAPDPVPAKAPGSINAVLSDKLTKVSFVPAAGDAAGLSAVWSEGDVLRVYDHADHARFSDFTLDDGCVGDSEGTFSGEGFLADAYDVEVLGAVPDYSVQVQAADASSAHLKYVASVGNVADYSNIVFEGLSGVLRITASLPSTDVVSAVSSVELSSGSGWSLKVNLSEASDAGADARLVLFANLPAGGVELPEGTSLTARFNTPGTDRMFYTGWTELGAQSFSAGKLNELELDCRRCGLSAGASDDGSGAAPYLIADKYQMDAVHELVVPGRKVFFRMVADVDMDAEMWTPLNTESPYTRYISFDGGSHTLRNFRSSGAYASLFGVMNGQVHDLIIEDALITPEGNQCAVLASYLGNAGDESVSVSDVTVRNCSVGTPTTKGTGSCGILASQLHRAGTSLRNVAVIGSSLYSGNYSGGLVGSVTMSAEFYSCSVSGCTIDCGSATGGLIGQYGSSSTSSSCTGCHVSSTRVSGGGNVGGLIGLQYNGASRCSVDDAVVVNATGNNVGGFAGFLQYNSIEDSYSRAAVSGNKAVGGLVGYMSNKSSTQQVVRCYASGLVSGSAGAGGLVGEVGGGTVSKSISWNNALPLTGASTGTVNSDCYTMAASESGTVSSHAQEDVRAWPDGVWDLSSPFPMLKTYTIPDVPAQETYLAILPYPHELTPAEGSFDVYGAGVHCDASLDESCFKVIRPFASRLGVSIRTGAASSGFVFAPDNGLAPEAYTLDISAGTALVKASSREGFFYAVQTIRQLLPVEIYGSTPVAEGWKLPCMHISDRPRFGYRGLHLDVSRHFFSVDEVKRVLDIMAVYKLNRLHWHLTDDQGWRIQIDAYPNLTQVGAWRDGTQINKTSSADNVRYGGFYTKDDIREVLNYADERCITVIPEIDMPGHMVAALASYPELGCTGGPYEVWKFWGISQLALCPGKEATWTFLKGVLTEVAELFPSEYIHIGGDECRYGKWEQCADCQALISSLGLTDEGGVSAEKKLQYHVTEQLQDFLAGKGKKMIGWGEILGSKLSEGTAIMSWTSRTAGINAAKADVDAIMCPSYACYFDQCQTEDIDSEPLSSTNADRVDRAVTVPDCYALDPLENIPADKQHHILGAQACLWSEYIATGAHLEYMLLPRLAALSEVQWTDLDNKDINRLKSAIGSRHFAIYDTLGYNFRRKQDY